MVRVVETENQGVTEKKEAERGLSGTSCRLTAASHHFTVLCLSFLICKMGMIMVPTS